jgi:hypothetical protein
LLQGCYKYCAGLLQGFHSCCDDARQGSHKYYADVRQGIHSCFDDVLQGIHNYCAGFLQGFHAFLAAAQLLPCHLPRAAGAVISHATCQDRILKESTAHHIKPSSMFASQNPRLSMLSWQGIKCPQGHSQGSYVLL